MLKSDKALFSQKIEVMINYAYPSAFFGLHPCTARSYEFNSTEIKVLFQINIKFCANPA